MSYQSVNPYDGKVLKTFKGFIARPSCLPCVRALPDVDVNEITSVGQARVTHNTTRRCGHSFGLVKLSTVKTHISRVIFL